MEIGFGYSISSGYSLPSDLLKDGLDRGTPFPFFPFISLSESRVFRLQLKLHLPEYEGLLRVFKGFSDSGGNPQLLG